MNEPPLPSWMKTLAAGLIVAWLGQSGAFLFWGLHLSWSVGAYEQRFDDRLSNLEKSWTISQAVEAKLDEAQRATDVHNAVWDQKMNDLTSKMEAVLQAIQDSGPPPPSGGTQAAPENFPGRPSGGR